MKIAIVGTGAMGSIYAGKLAAAGNEVWAIDCWQAHLDKIKNNCLTIEGPNGKQKIYGINTSQNIASAGVCELYIIATKAMAVEEAAKTIITVMEPSSTVLTIQNGLGSGDILERYINKKNILLGVADGFGASVRGPGYVHHNAMNLIRIGEIGGGITEKVSIVKNIWQSAGFNVKAFADINQLIWEKFLCNVSFSAPCTVFNCTVGDLMKNTAAWNIALQCGMEAYNIGRAKNISYSFEDPVKYITEFGSRMPNARPSMLLDHLSSRASEIDFINAMVTVLGRKLGLSTPINDTLSAIIKFREQKFR